MRAIDRLAQKRARRIMEDDPRWNPRTMGNLMGSLPGSDIRKRSDARSVNPRMGGYPSKSGYAIPYADDTTRSPYKRGRRK